LYLLDEIYKCVFVCRRCFAKSRRNFIAMPGPHFIERNEKIIEIFANQQSEHRSADKATSISQEFPIAVCGTLISSLLTRTQTATFSACPGFESFQSTCVWVGVCECVGGGFWCKDLVLSAPTLCWPFRLSSVAWVLAGCRN